MRPLRRRRPAIPSRRTRAAVVAAVLKGNLRWEKRQALENVEFTKTAVAARAAAGTSSEPWWRGMVATGKKDDASAPPSPPISGIESGGYN